MSKAVKNRLVVVAPSGRRQETLLGRGGLGALLATVSSRDHSKMGEGSGSSGVGVARWEWDLSDDST